MALQIDTPQAPFSGYSVTLGGTTFNFVQRWNDRAASWYLDISDASGTVIRKGAKLLPKVPLILRNKSLMPNGNLYIVKQITGYTGNITRDNLGLGSTFTLTYITTTEEGVI